MGVNQNTRAYRRRLNVVANKWHRNNDTQSQPELTKPPPVAVRIIVRAVMLVRANWPTILFVLWLAVVGAIGALSHC